MEGFDRGDVAAKRRDVDRLMATAPKHYIRQHVWLPRAIERRQLVGRHINYFTLTTSDLFDVRVLERNDVIEKTARGYPGVGFCELDDKQYDNISRKLQRCRWSYKGYFEEMVTNHPEFESEFAFDVVNLDFILVPFPGQESPLEGTWGAIQKLLRVQRSKQTGFDLFLTFRGSREGTNTQALQDVAGLLKHNLESGRGVSEFRTRVGHNDPYELLENDYMTFLCVGLPKLLVADALNTGFRVSRTGVYAYERQSADGPYYIVKFDFGLEIPQTSTPTFAQPPHSVSDYETLVSQVFETDVVDVSELLQSNQALKEKLEADLSTLEGR